MKDAKQDTVALAQSFIAKAREKKGLSTMVEGQPDRLNYSYGLKLSDGNFGSRDVHVSYSSDCKDGETPEQCLERIKTFVHSQATKSGQEIVAKLRGNN